MKLRDGEFFLQDPRTTFQLGLPVLLANSKEHCEQGVVAHSCNPSTWEAETGGSQVRGQPQLLREALCNLVRPCFKIKNKKKIGLGLELRGRIPLCSIPSINKKKRGGKPGVIDGTSGSLFSPRKK